MTLLHDDGNNPSIITTTTSHSPSIDQDDSTTSKVDQALRSIGGIAVSEYIEKYLSVSSLPSPSSPSSNSTTPIPSPKPPPPSPSPLSETRGIIETQSLTLYIKKKGKSKGSAILFDPTKSAVSQLFELAQQIPLLIPTYTVSSSGFIHYVSLQFAGHSWTDEKGTVSIKAGKEATSLLAIEDILHRRLTLDDK